MERAGRILVTGATGAQGGATVDALIEQGFQVRALVRDETSDAAKTLARRGASLVTGDFDDCSSLDAAVAGMDGVFSVQLPPTADDPDREVRTGRHLVEAAKSASVSSFVHTSVARADEHLSFVGWQENRWSRGYWESKAVMNDLVRAAAFPHWTILKPAFMMDNFVQPKVKGMFPLLSSGVLETAMAENVRLDLIAAEDIGWFAAAAFADPARFDREEIPLAAEALTMTEVAGTISRVSGRTVTARSLSADEMVQRGANPGLVSSQEWANVEGYRVDIASLKYWAVPLLSFEIWLRKHAERLPDITPHLVA